MRRGGAEDPERVERGEEGGVRSGGGSEQSRESGDFSEERRLLSGRGAEEDSGAIFRRPTLVLLERDHDGDEATEAGEEKDCEMVDVAEEEWG